MLDKQLMPPKDSARWYITSYYYVKHTCPDCHQLSREAPAVMHYVARMDHGGAQAIKHPDWPRLGWLAWWRCEHCGMASFTSVDDNAVKEWGRASSKGWVHL